MGIKIRGGFVGKGRQKCLDVNTFHIKQAVILMFTSCSGMEWAPITRHRGMGEIVFRLGWGWEKDGTEKCNKGARVADPSLGFTVWGLGRFGICRVSQGSQDTAKLGHDALLEGSRSWLPQPCPRGVKQA